MESKGLRQTLATTRGVPGTTKSIDWYAEGQARVVEVAGIEVVVHVVGRKGRRARIMIVAPAGAVFRSDAV